jgi:hypothetical protein
MARTREYTDAAMVKALAECRGLVYHAADRVGCHPDTIYDRAKVSEAVAAAIRRERGKVVDTAESGLFDALAAGEPWAIQFALRNLGKDRGYVERTEVEQKTEARLRLVEEVVGDDKDGEAA